MYRLNSLNADIQLIVDGASGNDFCVGQEIGENLLGSFCVYKLGKIMIHIHKKNCLSHDKQSLLTLK